MYITARILGFHLYLHLTTRNIGTPSAMARSANGPVFVCVLIFLTFIIGSSDGQSLPTKAKGTVSLTFLKTDVL